MVSRVTAPGILLLGTGRRCVVSFTLRSLYLPKMRALYHLYRVLADSQARFGRFGPIRNQKTILLSCGLWSNHYPDWRILASSKYQHYGLLAVCNNKLQFVVFLISPILMPGSYLYAHPTFFLLISCYFFYQNIFRHSLVALSVRDSKFIINKYVNWLVTGELIGPLNPHM
jgi:hypothetical protein